MSNLTPNDVKQEIKSYIEFTFQDKGEFGGWGKGQNEPVSIVNTVEALLTLREIEALDDYLKDAPLVKKYLCSELNRVLGEKFVKTGYLAYGAIGLDMIGDHVLRDTVVEQLLRLARHEGWPAFSSHDKSGLVPTFQALFALQKVGKSVDQIHYDWLLRHQKPNNNLCSFELTDSATSIGASCLVLYLLANSGQEENYHTRDLANAVQPQLSDVFTQMLEGSNNWVSEDRQTRYKIYGYGFGLRGLDKLGILDLSEVGINKFIKALSKAILPISEGPSSALELSCDPSRSLIPAVLELAIASRVILNLSNPYKLYLELEKTPTADSDEKQLAIEREFKLIEIKQKILVAQEREILKRYNLWEQVAANQENLVNQINERTSEAVKKVAFVVIGGILLFAIIIYVFLRIIKPEVGSTIADIAGVGLGLASIWPFIYAFRRQQKK